MRFKTTWILIAVFAALAAYLYFVENPREQAKEAAKEKEGILFSGFEPEKVTEMSVRSAKGTVRVRKGADGVWVTVEPWDDRADAARIGNLLSDLKGLKSTKEVGGADADLKGFGLAEPEATVQTAGSEAKLEIGAENPAGDSRYLRANGGSVVVAKSSGMSNFLSDPKELRNKDVVTDFPWSRLTAVEIRPAQAEPILLAKKGETWTIEKPLQAEADSEAVQRAVDKVRYARISRFLDDDPAKAEAKLSKGVSLVLTAQGGEPPVTVRMADVEGSIWADRSGRKALFALNKDVFDALQVQASDLRRNKPVTVKPWKLKGVELTMPGTKLAYQKSEGKWRREGKPLSDAESRALEDALRALETGKADRVIDAPGPNSDYGLDKPELGVKTSETDGAEQNLILSRKGEKTFARSEESGPVYEMPGSYLKEIDSVKAAAEGSAGPGAEAPKKEGGE